MVDIVSSSTITNPVYPGSGLQLNEIREAIPPAAFEKSLGRSLLHMFFDYAMWGGAFLAFSSLVGSSAWATLPLALQAASTLLYWGVSGFFMWCIFVVGHDCGHTTFSNNKTINDIIGHITHGSLLVPFYPWQLSHRRHHLNHNHVDKDYSYIWFTPDVLARKEHAGGGKLVTNPLFMALFPFFGWQLYLLGINDGSHFLPLADQRLWKDTPKVEQKKCLISTAVVAAFATGIFLSLGASLPSFLLYYFGPHVVFSWWLVTVTYLQHHNEDSLVFDNHDWTFVDGALQTVDRQFGFGIDGLSHHITDGHLAHHLFFTQIPHYHLPAATKAIRALLEKRGLSHLYKLERTWDFPLRIHKYMATVGFGARRANPLPVEGVE